MSQIMNAAPLQASEVPSTDKEGKISTTITAKPTPLRQTVRFLVHFGEMGLAMLLGMFVLGIVNDAILVPMGYHLSRFPEVYTLAMAFSMTVPMVAWMWFRGHCWRHSAEMTGAMLVPAALLIGVCSLGLCPRTALLSWYHLLMWVAMLGVMLYRWSDYAGGSLPLFEKALLGIAVLICIGLTNVFAGALPAMTAGHAQPFDTTVKTTDGQFTVKLNVNPNRSGMNVFTVTVLDTSTSKSVTDSGVSLSTTMPDMVEMGTDTITLLPDGKGHFSATGDLSMGGKWQIRVQIRTPDGTLHEAIVKLLTSS